ncbi:glycosyltransferase family 2 protein [Bizionia sp.]|uniref:glycosyltransferase family 2 protein n=1 Tax=Bizionia sp. TaxID=1954480 RepID=UPI003A91FFF4
MEELDLAIIIVTYNGMPWLKKCLDSCGGYSVVVVDNASTDETVSFIETQYPEVTIFKQNHNLGFGQANNLGIRYALNQGAAHVFLLNQDAYLVGDCLEDLLEVSSKNSDFGILSPIHLNGTGDKLDKGFSNYVTYDKNELFYSDAVLNTFKAVYQVPFVNAAAWLITKACLEVVGEFDPIFFHYGEDINFSQRVIFHNFKIGVVASAFVKHDRESSKIKEGKRFSADYYNNIERRYKMNWADVSKNEQTIRQQAQQKINNLNSEIYKSLLKLKFSRFKNLKTEKKLVNTIIKDVLNSRKQNAVNKKTLKL